MVGGQFLTTVCARLLRMWRLLLESSPSGHEQGSRVAAYAGAARRGIVDASDTDNLVRMVFTDPAGPEFFTEWHRAAQSTVASLRLAVGHDSENAHLIRLVEEVSAASPAFRRYWEQGHVRGKTVETEKLSHPDVGALTLIFQSFDVREKPGQQLVIYHAEPGSPSAHALDLLGSPAATKYRDRGRSDPASPDRRGMTTGPGLRGGNPPR